MRLNLIMKFNKLKVLILCTVSYIVLSYTYVNYVTIDSHAEETRVLKIVFNQDSAMITDTDDAETYVNGLIEAKLEKIEQYNKRKAEYQEAAKAAHEEYLAQLAASRRAKQAAAAAAQQTYTAPEASEAPADGSPRTYHVTGYVATGNPCASGAYPTEGYTIASNSLPMGTRVYIEGIGERVVEDTGGMAGNVIDVFCGSESECFQLTGDYEVYILDD